METLTRSFGGVMALALIIGVLSIAYLLGANAGFEAGFNEGFDAGIEQATDECSEGGAE